MNDHEVYALLHGVFNDVFSRDDIVLTPTTVAPDIVGWDSFKHVEIVLALEDRLGIEISTTEATGLHSVEDLVQLLQRKLRGLRAVI